MAQVRYERSLAGCLRADTYLVRPAGLFRRARFVSADEIRQELCLRAEQALGLLLFDDDAILERLWSKLGLAHVAAANYDFVVCPSYSMWSPRPRTDGLYNAKRSIVYFEALQRLNVPAIPRVAWDADRDVERFAAWANANVVVELVGLDLQTYKTPNDWRAQIRQLATFDRLTGARLRYLVNGPTTMGRIADLFGAVDPGDRLHITNATTQLAIRRADPDHRGVWQAGGAGSRFEAQCRVGARRTRMARTQPADRP